MKLSFPYVSYPSLIKPDICRKIIDLGISKIEKNKKEGVDNTGTTLNQKEKSKIRITKCLCLHKWCIHWRDISIYA